MTRRSAVPRVPDPLADALDRAGDGAFVIDANGRITAWNRAATRMLGFTARDVVGRPCCEVFEGHDEAGNRLCYPGCHIQTLVRMQEPVSSFDMRARTKAGCAVWLNVSILTLPGNGSGGPLTLHLFRDVTAAKELLTLVHERLSGPNHHDDGANGAGALTRRELEVLRLLASGANTKAAAERLHVSTATIRNHVQNIFGKLDVHSRLEAVAHAMRHRLL